MDLALGWQRLQVYAQPVKGSGNHLATSTTSRCVHPLSKGPEGLADGEIWKQGGGNKYGVYCLANPP